MSIGRFAIFLLIACLGIKNIQSGGVWSSSEPQTVEFGGTAYPYVKPVYLQDKDINDPHFLKSIDDIRIRFVDLLPCEPVRFMGAANFAAEQHKNICLAVCYKQPVKYYSKDMCSAQEYVTWRDVADVVGEHLRMLEDEQRIVPVAALRAFLDVLQNDARGCKDWIYAIYLLVLKMQAFYKAQALDFFARESRKLRERREPNVWMQTDDVLVGFSRGPGYSSSSRELVQDFQTAQNIFDALFYVLVARIHETTGCFYKPFEMFRRFVCSRLMPLVYMSPDVTPEIMGASVAGANAVIAVLEHNFGERPFEAAGSGSARSSTTASSLSDHLGAE